MNYVELKIDVAPVYHEILIAELLDLGYESFQETETSLLAYLPEDDFQEGPLSSLSSLIAKPESFFYEIRKIPDQNWNQLWEKSFNPIEIAGKCRVRGTFHEASPEFLYEIVIDPKMAFGTGHHATTEMMLQYQLELEHAGKRVLDLGCGTAILSIMAEMRGAAKILGVEIETPALENAHENLKINNCHNVNLQAGTVRDVSPEWEYDIILANINRNVLLDEMPEYVQRLSINGLLLLSGFYENDRELIEHAARDHKLTLIEEKKQLEWMALLFRI